MQRLVPALCGHCFALPEGLRTARRCATQDISCQTGTSGLVVKELQDLSRWLAHQQVAAAARVGDLPGSGLQRADPDAWSPSPSVSAAAAGGLASEVDAAGAGGLHHSDHANGDDHPGVRTSCVFAPPAAAGVGSNGAPLGPHSQYDAWSSASRGGGGVSTQSSRMGCATSCASVFDVYCLHGCGAGGWIS